MKKILKIIGIVILVIIMIPIIFLAYLRIIMYDPDPTESVEYTAGGQTISPGEALSVLTFNIGYGGYNKDEDFFMDGGKGVMPDSRDEVMANLSGITSIIEAEDCDVNLIQEVDIDSKRSYRVNEYAYINSATGLPHSFATNYKCVYVPFPIPPVGRVYSGVATLTELGVYDAERVSLPETTPWYMRMAYLKRCMLVERVPLENSDRELVLVNLHLEAYTDQDKRKLQVDAMNELLLNEYEKGNYVIAGGDFNQAFAELDNPPLLSDTGWEPGSLSQTEIVEGLSLAVSDNAPSCRSLEEPFIDNDTSQTYIIDGFIVSDNVKVNKVEVRDYGFGYSDHNPVRLEVVLMKE